MSHKTDTDFYIFLQNYGKRMFNIAILDVHSTDSESDSILANKAAIN